MRRYAVLTPIAAILLTVAATAAGDADRIRPYEKNPYYWQYKGEPVLLLGGSWQDNLFNQPIGLERRLDLLTSVGGNYLRNVMSHRNEGNVFPYEHNEDGLSASWFDPQTAETQDAVPAQDGAYVPPSADHWILLLR